MQPCSAAEVKTEPKTVIIYGDSITAGEKVPSSEHSHLWVLQVEANSKGTLHTINEGKGGRPTNSLPEFDEML